MKNRFMRNTLLILSISLICSNGIAMGENTFREKMRDRLRERAANKRSTETKTAPSTLTPIKSPGTHTFSFDHDGLTRSYIIHVPPQYNPGTPTAMIIIMHGGGGDMKYQSNDKNYGNISHADKYGYIAVFPNGYSNFRGGRLATWNAGKCCGQARDNDIDDVGFLKTMIERIQKQLNIDHEKIFATGMSNGGLMSYRLACEMAGTIKAIAPVAGTDNTLACSPSRPVSVLHIHAQDDTHVLFTGGAGADAFKDRSKVTEFVSVPDTISKWVNFNRCNPTPKRVLENSGAYCDLYSSCANDTEVKLCVTATGGHSWPGGGNVRGKQPSTAISANDMMWDFFKNQ